MKPANPDQQPQPALFVADIEGGQMQPNPDALVPSRAVLGSEARAGVLRWANGDVPNLTPDTTLVAGPAFTADGRSTAAARRDQEAATSLFKLIGEKGPPPARR